MNDEQRKFLQSASKEQVEAWLKGTTDLQITRFKRKGREYHIQTDNGEFWFVPAYSGKNRLEITPEELRDHPIQTLEKIRFVQMSLNFFGGKVVNVKHD